MFQYALSTKSSIVQASTFLYGLLSSACSYADKNLNSKCKLLRDLVGLEGDSSKSKLDLVVLDEQPSNGLVYNILKLRTGFFTRIKVCKDEIIKQEAAAQKGKKAKQSNVVEDTSLTSLPLLVRTIHQHYRENDYIIKETFKTLL